MAVSLQTVWFGMIVNQWDGRERRHQHQSHQHQRPHGVVDQAGPPLPEVFRVAVTPRMSPATARLAPKILRSAELAAYRGQPLLDGHAAVVRLLAGRVIGQDGQGRDDTHQAMAAQAVYDRCPRGIHP